jgi:hypothetical protein
MDIIQTFIETSNAGKSGWRIANNKGALGVVTKRTSNVSYSILNNGVIPAGSNFINTYSTTPAPTITATPSATTTGTTGNYPYQVFTYTTETDGEGTGQTQYTINVGSGGMVCDILMVGGDVLISPLTSSGNCGFLILMSAKHRVPCENPCANLMSFGKYILLPPVSSFTTQMVFSSFFNDKNPLDV